MCVALCVCDVLYLRITHMVLEEDNGSYICLLQLLSRLIRVSHIQWLSS